MKVSRRRIFQSLAVTGACGVPIIGAEPAITLDLLRHVSTAHGANLSDDRLRVILPVLEQRLSQMGAFRDFAVDDSVAPTQGVLIK